MRISIKQAQELLEQHTVVAVPTETVYGLAAALHSPTAIAKIFMLKQRPQNNPLIVHAANVEDLKRFVSEWPADFDVLVKQFWPGPLTLILPCHVEHVPEMARAKLITVACRIPNHPLTLQLLQRVGPLVAPSANLSGRPSATQPAHVEADFGIDFPVLDGGMAKQGVESTILHAQAGRWYIARLGAISAEELQAALGYLPQKIEVTVNTTAVCPGQLYRHYAPAAELYLQQRSYDGSITAVLGFSDRLYLKVGKLIALGSQYQPAEVAANLYASLRLLDQLGLAHVWVDMNFPRIGLWATIAERLSKAAQK